MRTENISKVDIRIDESFYVKFILIGELPKFRNIKDLTGSISNLRPKFVVHGEKNSGEKC